MVKKVIVIGLDGFEPTIVDSLMNRGELPHLAALAAEGGYSRIATTTPAQTPVAWSTFATGMNPGGHGIFDFICRDPKTYLPDLALNRYESRGPLLPPRAVNRRQGETVWEILSAAGIESTILRCPATYPPDVFKGRMLSGMGVPDLRGGLGTPTFYSERDEVVPGESERILKLERVNNGEFQSHLIGPRNPRDRTDAQIPFQLMIREDGAGLSLEGSSTGINLPVGVWSDWVLVKFKVGILQSVRGMVRFLLVRTSPTVELYASPMNFDPESPLFHISHPTDYAAELSEEIGFFYTTGMIEDHTGLNNERFDEQAFLDQCDLAWGEREAMMIYELKRFEAGLFYCLFDTPDRIQHMFWRFGEPDHPANRGRAIDRDYSHVINDVYRRGDAVVDKVMEFVDEDTLLVVLSDHGFGGFRRGVNLNTLLHQVGMLTLRNGVRPGEGCRDLLRDIDWTKTKAYALGLGGIYLNLAGREGQGIVSEAEAGTVKQEIINRFSGLIDPFTGETAIRSVRTREQVYSGVCIGDAPDLLVDFERGYRVSWGTSLGGVATEVCEDNVKKWSGDHIIDPLLVPGILFMNRPFASENASLLDVAPTILQALGVAKGQAMEGSSLLR